jgi:hypothetical protein
MDKNEQILTDYKKKIDDYKNRISEIEKDFRKISEFEKKYYDEVKEKKEKYNEEMANLKKEINYDKITEEYNIIKENYNDLLTKHKNLNSKIEMKKNIYNYLDECNKKVNLNEYILKGLEDSRVISWKIIYDNDTIKNKKGLYINEIKNYNTDLELMKENIKNNENLIIKNVSELIIEPSQRLIKTDTDKFYYSSTINTLLKDFEMKDYIWMSEQFEQALIHIFESNSETKLNKFKEDDLIQPMIFRFKFNKKVNLIQSDNLFNKSIFKFIIPDEGQLYLQRILARYLPYFLQNGFTQTNNIGILLILEQLHNHSIPIEILFSNHIIN